MKSGLGLKGTDAFSNHKLHLPLLFWKKRCTERREVIRRMAREALEEDDRGETLALAYSRGSNARELKSQFVISNFGLHRFC